MRIVLIYGKGFLSNSNWNDNWSTQRQGKGNREPWTVESATARQGFLSGLALFLGLFGDPVTLLGLFGVPNRYLEYKKG